MKQSYHFLTAAITVIACSVTHAGHLNDTYNAYLSAEPELEAAGYKLQAAEQRIETKRRNYLPKISANARELYVGQDIKQEDNVFEDGSDSYGKQRAKLEIDQPLIDLTIKPQIEAAKALQKYHNSMLSAETGRHTQLVIESYVQTAECFALEQSLERVIKRLRSELEKVTKNFDAQLATVEDVQNIKVSLAAAEQENQINREILEYSALNIGIPLETINRGPFTLTAEPDISSYAESRTALASSDRVDALRAEVTAYDKEISALKKRDLPRLSLYGLYEYDDADGSEFGGERRLNQYEVGISLDWSLFDRGITRSESKEMLLLRRAKDAELRAVTGRESRRRQTTHLSAQRALANMLSLEQIVKHKKVIHDAAERSHTAGGSESYISMINSFLIYEAQVRQLERGRYDCLIKQVRDNGETYGWSNELVNTVDALFAQNY